MGRADASARWWPAARSKVYSLRLLGEPGAHAARRARSLGAGRHAARDLVAASRVDRAGWLSRSRRPAPSADEFKVSHTAITIHPPLRCEGYRCPWHNPSDHGMVGWPRDILTDRHNPWSGCAPTESVTPILTRWNGSIESASPTMATMPVMVAVRRPTHFAAEDGWFSRTLFIAINYAWSLAPERPAQRHPRMTSPS